MVQDSGAKLRAAALEGLGLDAFKTVLRAATVAADSQQTLPHLILNSQDEVRLAVRMLNRMPLDKGCT